MSKDGKSLGSYRGLAKKLAKQDIHVIVDFFETFAEGINEKYEPYEKSPKMSSGDLYNIIVNRLKDKEGDGYSMLFDMAFEIAHYNKWKI